MAAKKKKKTVRKNTKKSRSKKPSKKSIQKKSRGKSSKAAKKTVKKGPPKAKIIGVVTHYFPQVQAAVIKLQKPLAVGDRVSIKGSTTDFDQAVESIQIDRAPIQKAKKGDEIGLQVKDRVREHDLVLFPD